jgi:transposase-like protein
LSDTIQEGGIVSQQIPRIFTAEFKERAVLRLEAGASASALASELGVRRKLLYDWRQAYREHGVAGLNRKRGPKPGKPRVKREPAGDALSQAQARIAELERLVGQQQVDIDFFRRALRLIDAEPASGSASKSTRSSKR